MNNESLSPAERVDRIMRGDKDNSKRFPGVLFEPDEIKDGKPPADAVLVEGVVGKYGFHRQRLEASRAEVVSIIREVVADPFLKGKGDGCSFLALCEDRNGSQWAEHRTMDSLICLSLGLGLAGFCLPRKLWDALPGGMPYVWFEVPS